VVSQWLANSHSEVAYKQAGQMQLLFDTFPSLRLNPHNRSLAIRSAFASDQASKDDGANGPTLGDRLRALHLRPSRLELLDLLQDSRAPAKTIFRVLKHVTDSNVKPLEAVKPFVMQWVFTPGFASSIKSLVKRHPALRVTAQEAVKSNRLELAKLSYATPFCSALGMEKWDACRATAHAFDYGSYQVNPSERFASWPAFPPLDSTSAVATGRAFVQLYAPTNVYFGH
jgi:hypothetical protein